jgi:alpha-1,3-glucosyltransferase
VQRGLLHSYWAPNLWALYASVDLLASAVAAASTSSLSTLPPLLQSILSFIQQYLPPPRPALSSTLGLDRAGVGMRLLPDITAAHAAAAAAMLFLPFAVHSIATRRLDGGRVMVAQTMQMMAAAALCSFMAGYHVHEKSILIAVMLLLPVAVALPAWRSFYTAFRYPIRNPTPCINS